MTDEERGYRYFDEEIAPGLRADGMPDDGVAHLRSRYVQDALATPGVVAVLREMYPARKAES